MQLLTNGSFETGDFTGWNQGGNFEFTSVVTSGNCADNSYAPQQGSFFVCGGAVGSDSTLSQTFSDTAGMTLVVSGWLDSNGTTPNDFSMMFDSTTLVSLTDIPTTTGYEEFSFDVTATGSDSFTAAFRDDPDYLALGQLLGE